MMRRSLEEQCLAGTNVVPSALLFSYGMGIRLLLHYSILTGDREIIAMSPIRPCDIFQSVVLGWYLTYLDQCLTQ